jgi:hypothetical protein
MSSEVQKFIAKEWHTQSPKKTKQKSSQNSARMRYMILTKSYIHPENKHIPFYPSSLRLCEENKE